MSVSNSCEIVEHNSPVNSATGEEAHSDDHEPPPQRKVVRIDTRPPEDTLQTQGVTVPLIQREINGAEATIRRQMSQLTPTGQSPVMHGAKYSFISQKSSTSATGLSLYEDDASTMPTLAAYLRSFTIPGPLDRSDQENRAATRKVTKLGTLLGVYLPTIQHILGVQMFLRLLWIVGIGGITHSFIMVFICCLCTLLTCISISAIATNGVIESGGAYFMISRNLGPEFGTAVGILYYLANTVATSMYLIGGVEILLMYIAPDLPQFTTAEHGGESGDGHSASAAMFNNFRLYGTGLLLVVIAIVALGVKFVQCFAPVSLFCVIVSIVSVYVGGFVASAQRSPSICLVGDRLMKPTSFMEDGQAWCNKSDDGPLYRTFCLLNNGSELACDEFLTSYVGMTPGIPGFSTRLISENAPPTYMETGQVAPGKKAVPEREVAQDITTNFFIIMAIFFPSVTGIFTGANMSGDLKDPQRSLPVGTIAAQLTTSFVYLSFVLVFGGAINGALLRDKYGDSLNNKMIVALLAWPNEWVLLVGSFTSTFGAALQCLCSAPRLLQSIARDDVIPYLRTFSDVSSHNEPVKALIVTSIIAEVGILIGSIDDVAPVVDFFFLMCYCFVNIVCVLQTLLNAPNWRPRFKFYHWSLSLFGAVLCMFIMFATYWYYALVVSALCAFIYKYVEFKGAKKEWGDGISGLALSTAQYSLLKVENRKYQHPKNWRPQLIVMVKDTESQWFINRKLLQVAGQLKAGQGLTIVASLIVGDTGCAEDRDRAEELDERLQSAMKQAKVRGFTKVVVCQNLAESVNTLVQSTGVGGLRPNTVMVGWPYHWKQMSDGNKEYNAFLDAIHRASTAEMCLLVPKGLMTYPDQDERLSGTIDVWWIIHDGGLLIVLPFLLKQHKVWRQCKLRVFAVAQMHDNSIKMRQDLQQWVYQLRIDASVDVVELADSTISAYTYERTLLMEERYRLAMDLHLSRQDIQHEPQLLADRNRSRVGLSMLGVDDRYHPTCTRAVSAIEQPRIKSTTFTLNGSGSSAGGATLVGKRSCMSALPTVAGAGGAPPVARFFHGTPPATPKVSQIFETPPVVTRLAVGAMSRVAELSPEIDVDASPVLSVNVQSPSGIVDDTATINDDIFTFAPKNDDTFDATVSTATERRKTSGAKPSPFDVAPSSIADAVDDIEEDRRPTAYAKLDHRKVRKMHTAVNLNAAIREKSSGAELVVLNLPRPPRSAQGLANYMHYLEALTDGLDRVLLVRGSGKEVITIYS